MARNRTPAERRLTASASLARSFFASGATIAGLLGSSFAAHCSMAAFLGSCIDLFHALLMAAWVLGLPLLFWHRWPRLTRAYALYAIVFIVTNQLSYVLLHECFLTALARMFWRSAPSAGSAASDEWFTVRLAQAIFALTPSHRAIKVVSEGLILVTAAGMGFLKRRARRSRAASAYVASAKGRWQTSHR
jgi:hypothetical protein